MRNRSRKNLARPNGNLPDLDHAKTAVLSTLSSPDSQRCYRFAIEDSVVWYCSEPRLPEVLAKEASFNAPS